MTSLLFSDYMQLESLRKLIRVVKYGAKNLYSLIPSYTRSNDVRLVYGVEARLFTLNIHLEIANF